MIGEEIRRRRIELGLTGAQLAERASMAPSAVSQIETGKRVPNSASVIKLAGALGVGVGDLYQRADPPLFEDEGQEALSGLSDTDLSRHYEELLDRMHDLREAGKHHSGEYGLVMVNILRAFQELRTREKSRTLA